MTEQQTPDREKKIAEIREALEKATQGPWKWIDPGGLERKKLVGEWEIMNFGIGGVYDQVAGSEPDEDDAHLIANAPEWLGFLLDELERLEREYAEERAAHNAHVAELCELEQERNMYKRLRHRLPRREVRGVRRYACNTCDYEDESYEAVLKHIESSHGKKDSDPVHSPAHYTAGGIETIDFIRAKLSREEFVGYCRGNVLKYVTRAPHKGGVEDYRKAAVYLQWAIEAATR